METLKVQADPLEIELAQFTGTENWYRHLCGVTYTDGMKYLADKAGAYWLLDVIASYQPQWKRRAEFQVWRIEKNKTGNGAVVTMREDTDEPVRIRQRIPFTDFPLQSFECYAVDGVILLKSEY